ncbi:MAG: ParB/RepB/Spo0J family partition protein [Alphaproteobacteria bacterium]|nr:ParB/RepB/Spo0J family partition protein [Alphaproteobacteria bacterium]
MNSKKPQGKAQNKQEKQNNSKGLGKGLSALLGDKAAISSMGVNAPAAGIASAATAAPTQNTSAGGSSSQLDVAIEKVITGPWQPRQRFDEDSLNDLAESIRQHGVVQPLLVRPNGDRFELIAGERRWRAAQKAGLHHVPVVIRETSDQMAAEIAMIENIQRHDLSPVEEAEGYRRLIDEFDYTQETLAKVIGKSRSHLANTMRLLNLPDAIRDLLKSGELTAGQVRPLVGRDDAAELGQIVLAKGMSARQVEALVAQKDRPVAPKAEKSPDMIALEKDLRDMSGFDIALSYNDTSEKGTVTIKAASLEQFEAIIAKLQQ